MERVVARQDIDDPLLDLGDFLRFYKNSDGDLAEMALTSEGVERLVEDLMARGTDPVWLISPKTHHQLLRWAARGRHQHRAWLRAKRQRRARQRRHSRGRQ